MKQVLFRDDDIIEFTTNLTQCVYLKDKTMQISYKYIKECSQELASSLTQRGWRRFGEYFSRPSCEGCSECISVRIDAKNFKWGRSKKRLDKKNSDIKIEIRDLSLSNEHLNLYNKYHKYMRDKKGWEYFEIDKRSYEDLYLKGSSTYSKEILYRLDDRLVGVDLVDIFDDGISSIYFYYDPDFRSRSLGTYSIYKEIEYAKRYSKRWIYLGYSVKDNDSLNYKLRYQPLQKLKNNPTIDELPIWT